MGQKRVASLVQVQGEYRLPPHKLEDVLGCEVDLLTVSGLRNPLFKKRILEERTLLYEG